MENHFDIIMQGTDLNGTSIEQLKIQKEREKPKGWKTELIQGITTIISVSNGYYYIMSSSYCTHPKEC